MCVCLVQHIKISVVEYELEHTMAIVRLVRLYIQKSEPDESRLNHYCAIETWSLPCDIKAKVLPDGSYPFTFIQISQEKNMSMTKKSLISIIKTHHQNIINFITKVKKNSKMNHHHNNYLKGCWPNFTEQAIRKVFWNASIMINERLTFYQDNSLSKQCF